MTVANNSDVVTLKFDCNINSKNITHINSFIKNVMNRGGYRIILNFDKVHDINITSLGLLVERLRIARNFNGDIKITGLNQSLYNTFKLVGASRIFEIFESEEDAFKRFKSD